MQGERLAQEHVPKNRITFENQSQTYSRSRLFNNANAYVTVSAWTPYVSRHYQHPCSATPC